jgi:hypothetical protein
MLGGGEDHEICHKNLAITAQNHQSCPSKSSLQLLYGREDVRMSKKRGKTPLLYPFLAHFSRQPTWTGKL